jgi:hypothetical protein
MSDSSNTAPLALRIVTIGWAALTLIHFTIWALVCIVGGDLDRPWWLWFALPPGVVIGPLWWLARRQA